MERRSFLCAAHKKDSRVGHDGDKERLVLVIDVKSLRSDVGEGAALDYVRRKVQVRHFPG